MKPRFPNILVWVMKMCLLCDPRIVFGTPKSPEKCPCDPALNKKTHIIILKMSSKDEESIESLLKKMEDETSSTETKLVSSAANGGFGDCSFLYAKFSRCLQPSYQLGEIHKSGQPDNCGDYFSDWRSCLGTKLTKDEEKKKVCFLK
jgi:hypothetical protein